MWGQGKSIFLKLFQKHLCGHTLHLEERHTGATVSRQDPGVALAAWNSGVSNLGPRIQSLLCLPG